MNNITNYLNELSNQIAQEQILTATNITQSLNTTQGWLELGITVLLAWTCFWLSQRSFIQNRIAAWQWRPIRHIAQRIIWPVFMFVTALLIELLLYFFISYPMPWFKLLSVAANWMIGIRLAMAILHLALPQGKFTVQRERTFSFLLWVYFLLKISGIDQIIINWMQSLSFSVGSHTLNLYTVLVGIVWVGIVMVLMMWFAKWLETRLMASRMDINLKIVLSKVIRTLLMILSILIALPLVGIDLTVLSVFGGALGVGLGFGLQKIASNYVSGFIILADRSIRPGDRLNVNGFTGYVTQITSRFVVLRSISGQEALIPNETFVTSTVINESYTNKALWQQLQVQVSYGSNIERAMEIMTEAAAAQKRVSTEPAPKALLLGFGDNGVDLSIGFWVTDPENGFLGLFSNILMNIWKRFNEEGIEFPFPQREVRILNESTETLSHSEQS